MFGDIEVKTSQFVPDDKVYVFNPDGFNNTNPCGETQSTVFMNISFFERRKVENILSRANEWVKESE